MGMLEAPKGESAKQLGAGAAAAKGPEVGAAPATASIGGLTAEDLKELEDLDLSELDTKEAKKA